MNSKSGSVLAWRGAALLPSSKLLITATVVALLFAPSQASAQVAPSLGTAEGYAILGTNINATSGTVTCTDTGPGTAINGNVGSTFNTITNNGPCTITGSIDAPVAASVVTDFNAAYNSIDGSNPTCDGVIPIVDTTLPPGVYCSAAGTTIGAGVILTLDGTASDVWIFRVGTSGFGALTLTNAQVVMGSAALACNVYWKTAQAATLTDSDFVGTILSGAAITMSRGGWFGRALATTDVTVTDAAPLTFAGCASPNTITVNKDFIPTIAAPVSVSLTCSSGTVNNSPQNAAEGSPAVFTVGGANLGTICTATETVPAGYTADQTNCVGVAMGGSCTITNRLIVACPTITVNPPTLPNPTVGVPYNATVTAIGGTGPYTFAVTSGLLPAGLVLSSGGAITGTPTTAGNSNFTITATDTSTGCTGFRDYSLVAACPVITVNPPTLPIPVVVGTPYNATITATGGPGPFTFAVTSGLLPAGLVLSSGGAITGTPTTAGNSNFTITATDTSTGCTGFRDYVTFTNGAAGIPALDFVGLTILMALLAGGGLLIMRRFSI